MRVITLEWINKAEGDWASAQREMRARNLPNFDAACFHAQQCAEKYLKARLTEASISFGKTHNLAALLNLVLPVESGWIVLQPHLNALNAYAVTYRYPGNLANKAEAKNAVKACRRVRRLIRESLGLTI